MANPFPTVRIVCAQCGKRAERSFSSTSNRPLYCGNACKVAAFKKANPAKAQAAKARELERYRVADRGRVRVVVLMNKLELQPKIKEIRYCPCGTELRRCRRLCDPCSLLHGKASKRTSPSRRADKAKRKAMARGRLDGAERFDPLEVLARDGWRCHICSISTPKRLRGTYGDRAPELDHIVPLAMGGQHTRLNTACACRRCNLSKAAKPLGQLRLIA